MHSPAAVPPDVPVSACLSTMAEGLIFVGADGHPRYCNPAAARLLNLTPEQLMGRSAVESHWRCIREDGAAFPVQQHPAFIALTTGQSQVGVRMGVYRDDGQLRWLRVNAEPVREAFAGTVSGVVATFADITAEVEASRHERDARARLEDILAAARAGYWEWEPATGRVEWSATWSETLGLRAASLESTIEAYMQLVHPDDRAAHRPAFEACVRGDVPGLDLQGRWRHADGHWLWVAMRGAVVERGLRGEALRVAGTCTDITERKVAEIRLAENEATLQAYFQATSVGIATMDDQGRWLRVNDAICAMLGWKREDLVGRSFLESVLPDDAHLQALPLRDLSAGRRRSFTIDQRYVRRDGELVWVMVTVSNVPGGPADPPQRILMLHDIGARKRAETNLADSEARYRALFDNLVEEVFVHDVVRDGDGALTDLRLREGNASARRLLGDAYAATCGQSVASLYGESWSELLAAGALALAGLPHRQELRMSRPECDLDVSLFRLDESTLVTAAVDISSRKRIDTALRDTLAERQRLIEDLQASLATIKQLGDLLPLCAWCKKVRSDEGYWSSLDEYLATETNTTVSHGICPDCAARFKGDAAK